VASPLLFAGFALGWTVFQVVAVRFVDPLATNTMVQRAIAHVRDGKGLAWPDRDVVSLEEMGATVPRAVLSAEDARFYLHDGFDWESVCGAISGDTRSRRMRGASTITQQTAKNVFLWQRRSWIRKGLEVWYTFLLERLVPKDRILELYLNVAETGPMVFGVEAGARHHFRKPARKLSRDEAARLAGIFPDPQDRSVGGSAARSRAAWVLANPAPIPGDPGWDRLLASWNEDWHGPWECLF
jgi:monofunctional biosynthetic peptidoglycan transglycosylase